MHKAVRAVLESHRAPVKRRWESLLRTAPSVSPLSNPDVMVYYMDEILDRIGGSLATAVEPSQAKHTGAGESARCGCGMNPLVVYFITGEQALIDTLASALGGDLHRLLKIYHDVAETEIANFCGVCFHRGDPNCPMNLAC